MFVKSLASSNQQTSDVIPAPYQVRDKLQQESSPCCHSRENGNPEEWKWIPPYQVRGRPSQARNDRKKELHPASCIVFLILALLLPSLLDAAPQMADYCYLLKFMKIFSLI
jgi:hypothetical protein